MMTRDQILAAIPHRPPFLLVDEVLEHTATRIVGQKTFSGREEFFDGHYPDYPLVPGVLLCEAAMQCGAILLAQYFHNSSLPNHSVVPGEGQAVSPHPNPLPKGEGTFTKVPVVTRMNDVRFKRRVRPGETLRLEVELVERLAEAFFLTAKVTVEGQLAVRFEFACMAAEK
jgi:3-hydroxyacyl-[acyl-carrier-protein] dehydratase